MIIGGKMQLKKPPEKTCVEEKIVFDNEKPLVLSIGGKPCWIIPSG
jgi:hypothetical protein